MEYLHVKGACSIPSPPMVGPESHTTANAQERKFLEVEFQLRSHAVSCRLPVLVLQGQVLFERMLPPLLTFSSFLRMLLQDAVPKARCLQKPKALVTRGVRMSQAPLCLSPTELGSSPGLPWLLAGDSRVPQLCSWALH